MTQATPNYRGKVRDTYDLGDRLLLVTTDRVSAFDRHIATIPHKGAVLNQLSAWWFEQTKDIVDNHFIAMPEPNSMEVKKCRVFPVEVVMRGYMTGTTNTSVWTLYQQGERRFFETTLPDGLHKNMPLPHAIMTPSTKSDEHDEPLTVEQLHDVPGLTLEQWMRIREKAFALFAYGQEVARQKGLILVDTKYEFGLDDEENILLIDECHTPDSSRYWLADSYQERIAQGEEPENFDKEFLRLWFRQNCDPYHDEVLPEAPAELVEQLSTRYQDIFQRLTGHALVK